MQLTIIFPIETGEELSVQATPVPPEHVEVEYEGYLPSDNASHFEVFMTPTPEPDSPAGEK